jgi:hypothetical protein
MEKITVLLELLKDYDLITLAFIGIGYLVIHKKINLVDRAVNQRPEGSKTISDEVSEINGKMDLFQLDLTHVKKEIDEHRSVDEKAFIRIEKDIRDLNRKL